MIENIVILFCALSLIAGFYVINKVESMIKMKQLGHWCFKNKWYYPEEKNYIIYYEWADIIRRGELKCKERMDSIEPS